MAVHSLTHSLSPTPLPPPLTGQDQMRAKQRALTHYERARDTYQARIAAKEAGRYALGSPKQPLDSPI